MARKYIPTEVKYRVRKEARNRCGYCLVRQDLIYHLLQIEHIIVGTAIKIARSNKKRLPFRDYGFDPLT